MLLKPQDIYVLLKLVVLGPHHWSYAALASDLGLSTSQLHQAIKRSLTAGLARNRNDLILPDFLNLEEFLVHGLRYAFMPERGHYCWGMLTAHAVAPLKGRIKMNGEPPPVWPDPDGEVKGIAFMPLYKSAPMAARIDEQFYELLALTDAVRSGWAATFPAATQGLKNRLEAYSRKF